MGFAFGFPHSQVQLSAGDRKTDTAQTPLSPIHVEPDNGFPKKETDLPGPQDVKSLVKKKGGRYQVPLLGPPVMSFDQLFLRRVPLK